MTKNVFVTWMLLFHLIMAFTFIICKELKHDCMFCSYQSVTKKYAVYKQTVKNKNSSDECILDRYILQMIIIIFIVQRNNILTKTVSKTKSITFSKPLILVI